MTMHSVHSTVQLTVRGISVGGMVTRPIWLICLLVGVLGINSLCSGQANSSNSASPNEPVLELNLQQRLQTVVIPVNINKKQIANCILDTGMPQGLFLMRPSLAAKCEFNYLGNANVQGTGSGSMQASVAGDVSLQVETVEWTNQRAIVLTDPGLLAHLGVDGAIGNTVFSQFIVQFDFDNQKVSFFTPENFDASELGKAIPLDIRNTKPYLKAMAAWDGKQVPVELLLDTGANQGLSINPSPNNSFQPPRPVISTHVGSGVGGDVMGSIGRIDSLQLGAFKLKEVTASFPEQGDSEGGTLGMEILNRFLVTIDYPNQRLFLEPNESFEKPFEFTMSGLSIKPDENGRPRVHSILDPSPAKEAGLEIGDTILSVDDRELTFAEFTQRNSEFRTPGRVIKIVYERKGRQHTVKLKLRRLL